MSLTITETTKWNLKSLENRRKDTNTKKIMKEVEMHEVNLKWN